MLLNQNHPLLHFIFQTANLYSCIFLFPGGKLQADLRLTTDWDSDIAGGFLFGWYPLSDAERKRQIIVSCEVSVGKPVLAAATEHAV